MSLSGGSGGIVPEAPRVTISLTKYNLTHDMVLESGVFAMHLLSAAPEQLERSLDIIRVLGGTTGRDVDKLAGFDTTVGVTGSPVLTDALVHIEGRVIKLEDLNGDPHREGFTGIPAKTAFASFDGAGRLGNACHHKEPPLSS